ncbi:hypothetical protein EHP00_691 [Ecytonucleospora hepatopenaei]|uniref:Uncharacterized protein n=1 Tax=Ecytonucleospora hepatopenaei TaxID=646526 RepID=A0A1W0E3S7_9MICR|nr:hypothetical protein EHP00_691 [Ecytonucleospora hepatopenaei]
MLLKHKISKNDVIIINKNSLIVYEENQVQRTKLNINTNFFVKNNNFIKTTSIIQNNEGKDVLKIDFYEKENITNTFVLNSNGKLHNIFIQNEQMYFIIKKGKLYAIYNEYNKIEQNNLSFIYENNESILYVKNNNIFIFGQNDPLCSLESINNVHLHKNGYIKNNKLYDFTHKLIKRLNLGLNVSVLIEDKSGWYFATNEKVFYMSFLSDDCIFLFEVMGKIEYMYKKDDLLIVKTSLMFYEFTLTTYTLSREFYLIDNFCEIDKAGYIKENKKSDFLEINNQNREIILPFYTNQEIKESGDEFAIADRVLMVFYKGIIFEKYMLPRSINVFIDGNYIILLKQSQVILYELTNQGLICYKKAGVKGYFINGYVHENEIFLEQENQSKNTSIKF